MFEFVIESLNWRLVVYAPKRFYTVFIVVLISQF